MSESQPSFDAQSVWEQACGVLASQLSEATFHTFITSNPLTDLQLIAPDTLQGTITSPSSFHATSVEKNLTHTIAGAISQVTGLQTTLKFVVGSPLTSSKTASLLSKQQFPPTPATSTSFHSQAVVNNFPTNSSSSQPSSFSKQTNTPPPLDLPRFNNPNPQLTTSPRVEDLFSPQTVQQATVNQAEFSARKAGLRPDYTFTTFAVSTTNEMAHAAATAVSQNPGLAYNPLFLYGGVGVGKTHLMHAIGNNIIFNNPTHKTIFCTGEQFTNEIVSAIQSKRTLQFKEKYRKVDVLLIDDIQFIAGKTSVQEEFFHTFNAVVQQRGQVVLTSDRPPHEINLLEDRLRSRFEAGLMIDIQQPTFELRTAILLIKAQAHGLDIPMDIAQLISSRVDSARKIEGIITSLRSEVELKGKAINVELVNSLLNNTHTNSLTSSQLRVSPSDVIKCVANHFHIKQVVIKGQARQKDIVRARHLAMYILKEELGLPFAEIGRWFSNRDHTTAMHACEKISQDLNKNATLQQEYSAINMSLRAISH